MDVFLEKCLQLLPVLGISHFNKIVENNTAETSVLYCKIKGLIATGQRTENGFVVFSGSQAVLNHRESAKVVKIQREQLINKSFLKAKEDYLVFTKDVEFGSPSTAASIVQGGSSNGLISWKDKQGTSLKEIEKNQVLTPILLIE